MLISYTENHTYELKTPLYLFKGKKCFKNYSIHKDCYGGLDTNILKTELKKQLKILADEAGFVFIEKYYCFDNGHIVSPWKYFVPEKIEHIHVQATFWKKGVIK